MLVPWPRLIFICKGAGLSGQEIIGIVEWYLQRTQAGRVMKLGAG
jgi:hypothetical protein